MKKEIQKRMMVLACCFAFCVLLAAAGTTVLAAGMSGESEKAEYSASAKASAKKNGWVKNSKWTMYYRNGKYVIGFQKIGQKTFYFNRANGHLIRNAWIRRDGQKYRTNEHGMIYKNRLLRVGKEVYYFTANGAVYRGWKNFKTGKAYFRKSNGTRAQSGLLNIAGKYYYFTSGGVMKTGTFTVGKTTYYMNSKGVMEARKVNQQYYDSSNKKMTQAKVWDFEATQNARKIASQITNSSMTKEQKLRKCFDWVMSKPYMTRRNFSNIDGWPALFANDHFVYGRGNCHSDAGAFAYLAKAIGYKNVYVCTDSAGWGTPHSWTEINGLVYDPLFAESKSFSRNYGVRYGVYILSAVLHIKIA